MTFTRVSYPEAPATVARRGTLLDAASVVDGNMPHIAGRDLFESFNCIKFDKHAEFCQPNAKDFDQVLEWVGAFRFSIYGGVTCNMIGSPSDMVAEAKKAFAANESVAVERALMATRFTADTEADERWDAPVDITPSTGPVKPATGVAMLEGFAGTEYVGQPTLHIPRSVAGLLFSTDGLVLDSATMRTKMGAPVAAGAGYDYPNLGPAGTEAPAGERWLYATGGVVVMRDEPIIREVNTPVENERLVFAERPYIAAVDCFAAAIRVTVE